MDEDYVMRPGDRFVARECGCSFTVITGPKESMMAIQPPQCCCGHNMQRDASFLGGADVIDIDESQTRPILAGMVE